MILASNFDENRDYGIKQWLMAEKLDGIRCAIYDGICDRHGTQERVFSRSGKRIPNHFIRSVLGTLPGGLDGELIMFDGNFQDATTLAMTEDLVPNNLWRYIIFDDFSSPDLPKQQRLRDAQAKLNLWHAIYPEYRNNVIMIYTELGTIERAKQFCANLVSIGAEGVMISDPNGKYIHRRCRSTEANLLKMKHFEDCEATIIALTHATYSGYTNIIKEAAEFSEYAKLKPRQMKELMAYPEFANRVWAYQGKEKREIGAIICSSAAFSESFSIGTGFSKEQRIMMAKYPELYIGKQVKLKYMPCGTKDRPRSPVFLGFRHEDDI